MILKTREFYYVFFYRFLLILLFFYLPITLIWYYSITFQVLILFVSNRPLPLSKKKKKKSSTAFQIFCQVQPISVPLGEKENRHTKMNGSDRIRQNCAAKWKEP